MLFPIKQNFNSPLTFGLWFRVFPFCFLSSNFRFASNFTPTHAKSFDANSKRRNY